MPLPLTHALAPVAAVLVRRNRSVPWRLMIAAAIASALPDVDSFSGSIWGMPNPNLPLPLWWHRGATHSLFVAIAVGLVAAALHRQLRVRALVAGVAVGAAMASHGVGEGLGDDAFDRPVEIGQRIVDGHDDADRGRRGGRSSRGRAASGHRFELSRI